MSLLQNIHFSLLMHARWAKCLYSNCFCSCLYFVESHRGRGVSLCVMTS